MNKYEYKSGDIVTINGVIKGFNEYYDIILVELPSGNKIIVTEADINTVCPKIEKPKEDMRRGS